MFFRNFKQILADVREKIDLCIGKLEKLDASQQQALQQSEENASRTEQKLSECLDGITRHDMAIEDMLDEWDEQKAQNAEQQKLREDSQKLLDTLIAYHDQIFFLRQSFGEDHPDWTRQLSMMEYLLEKKRILAGLQVIEQAGIPVDFELHEINGTEETSDKSLHGIISEVLSPGYVYQGKLLKKALVVVFRCRS